MKTFNIMQNDSGRTILKFLERMLSDVSKHRIEKAFRNKDVKLNNKRISDKKIILSSGDKVAIYGIEFNTKLVKYKPIQHQFNKVYEDNFILVVDKANGVVMSEVKDSLDNQVINYLQFKQKNSFFPSSIGRLDKVTSGLVIYAKDYQTLRELKEKSQYFEKIYLFESDLPNEVTTTYNIGHDEERQRETVSEKGKPSKTKFYFERGKKLAQIYTGRKHQIRVSLSKLGYPIYGDRKYGGKKADRVYLHCYQIKLANLSSRLEKINNLKFIKEPNWK